VNVQWQGGRAASRFHDQRPERDVWHEASIHHIDVNQLGPGRFAFGDLMA
jgi:hypothetical protein